MNRIKHMTGKINMRLLYRNSILVGLILLCVQTFVCARLLAQNKNIAADTGLPIIKNLSEKFDEIKSYTAEVNIVIGDEHKKEFNTAKVYYKNPDLFRMEIYSNDRLIELVVKNKEAKWHYIDIISTVFKYEGSQKEPDNVSINDVIMDFYNHKNLEYMGKTDVDGMLCESYDFDLINDNQKNRITVYINPANGMLKKIKMSEDNGSFSVEETFKDIGINAEVDDSNFVYVPAQGTQVVEVGKDQRYGVVKVPRSSKK